MWGGVARRSRDGVRRRRWKFAMLSKDAPAPLHHPSRALRVPPSSSRRRTGAAYPRVIARQCAHCCGNLPSVNRGSPYKREKSLSCWRGVARRSRDGVRRKRAAPLSSSLRGSAHTAVAIFLQPTGAVRAKGKTPSPGLKRESFYLTRRR